MFENLNLIFDTESNNDIWHERWRSLLKSLEDLATMLPNAPIKNQGLPDEWAVDLKDLIERIAIFGDRQLYFLYHGFPREDGEWYRFSIPEHGIKPEYLQKYVGWSSLDAYKDFVLARTLDQLSYDILILQLAFAQRNSDFSSSNSTDYLNDADALATIALAMFDDPILTLHSTALTYFRNVPAMRVIPYAHTPLIGIPLAGRSNVTADLLSIPHEMGHQLYWRGIDFTSISARGDIKQYYGSPRHHLPAMIESYDYKEWAEEIFADVISCLIGGPIVAWSAMQLALSHPPQTFKPKTKAEMLADKHPAPYIRPFIYFYVLKEIGFGDIAEQLKTYWKDLLKDERNVVIEDIFLCEFKEEPTDESKKEQPLPTHFRSAKVGPRHAIFNIIDTIFDTATSDSSPLFYFANGRTEFRWSEGVGEMDTWIEQFRNNQGNFIAEKLQLITQEYERKTKYSPDEPISIWGMRPQPSASNYWISQIGVYVSNELYQALIEKIPPELGGEDAVKLSDDGPEIIPAEQWLQVFEFGGWVTEHGNSGGVSGQPYG